MTISWRKFTNLAALLLLVGGGLAHGAGDPLGQWILVSPPGFHAALAPLIEHRQAEGFKVVVLETTDVLSREQVLDRDGKPLQARLKELTEHYHGRSYLLLAGSWGFPGMINMQNVVVPPLPGETGRMKNEASDRGYGFPGTNGTPSVAVGRFPAATVGQMQAIVQKTLRFEKESQPAVWRNRLVLLLTDPGGGPFASLYVQHTLESELAALCPSWEVRTLFTVASSRFYLPRPLDRQAALRYLGEGEMFSAYLGHSYAAGLGLDGQFMRRKDWLDVNIIQGAGPFFTAGCFGYQANASGTGYGVGAMRNSGGPVAVIGATGESYSAPGQLAVEGLLSCLIQPPFPDRLAGYWLAVQAGLARGKMDASTFGLLDMADGTGGKVPLATQRLEHLEMWMLLGDPALWLPTVPVDITLKLAEPILPGKPVTVSGVLPVRLKGATARLTLERPLESAPLDLEKLPPASSTNREARQHVFVANHQRANSFVLASAEATASGLAFVGSLETPAQLPWKRLICRASATLSNEMALGVVTIPVTSASITNQSH